MNIEDKYSLILEGRYTIDNYVHIEGDNLWIRNDIVDLLARYGYINDVEVSSAYEQSMRQQKCTSNAIKEIGEAARIKSIEFIRFDFAFKKNYNYLLSIRLLRPNRVDTKVNKQDVFDCIMNKIVIPLQKTLSNKHNLNLDV